MDASSIESQQNLSGIASAAGLKRIQKDRQRRPYEKKEPDGDTSPESDSRRNPDPEPRFLSEEIQEDVHLTKLPEESFREAFFPACKHPRVGVREQGRRIDIVI